MKIKSLVIWPVLFTSLGSTADSPTAPVRGAAILSEVSRELNQIAKKATPSVVSITSIRDPSLNRETLNEPSDQLALGVGSGVIVRADGLILTNLHVVLNAEKISVLLDDTHKTSAHLLGGDPKTDLAVIQLDTPPAQPLPTLSFGNSAVANVGDYIIAVGSPFGLTHTVTSGIISALGRGQLGMLDIEDFIQTDAAINPGNSGGPLLNSNGEMIGINTAIFSQTGGFTGVGFAIPSKIARQVVEGIIQHGHVIRGWIGVVAQDLDHQLASYFKAPRPEGALISQVQAQGPAAQAKIKSGDIVTRFGDQSIKTANQFKSLVASAAVSTRIPIELLRKGKPLQFQIQIQEQPETKGAQPNQKAGQVAHSSLRPTTHGDLGISVQDITPEISRLLKTPPQTGAIIADVLPGSPAFDVGLSVGDVIMSANQNEIHNAKELADLFDQMKKDDLMVLYVQKNPDQKLFIPMRKTK
jgi:serine protease Do